MSSPKVAIVIPAYNAEKTLASAVESVLAETLKDLEVVIVDDGSKDGTGRIADELAAKDARVKVLHQSNQGCVRARLNGIRASVAPYVGFVDADDAVEPELHERMLSFAEEHDLDVVECDSSKPDGDTPPRIVRGKEAVRSEVVYPLLFEGKGAATVWDKIYRRKCLSDDFCASYCICFEDFVLNHAFFREVSSFGRIHAPLYHYQVNDASVTRRRFSQRNILDFKEALKAQRRFCADYGVDADDEVFARWAVLNAGNLIKNAARSCAESNGERVGNVRAVLALEEVSSAVARLRPKFLLSVGRHPYAFVVKTRLRERWRCGCSLVKRVIKRACGR